MQSVLVSEIWTFFYDNKPDLKTVQMLVAENVKEKVEIYITEDGGFPQFRVEVDGVEVFVADAISSADTEQIYKDLLRVYIDEVEPKGSSIEFDSDDPIEPPKGSKDDVLDDDEYARRDELFEVTKSLLETFTEIPLEETGLEDSDVDTLASRIAEILYEEFGFATYFPTETENGVIAYPFGCFDK